ncbi:MAG: GFA family protein [Reyranella sp.]|uniref:GFA family protein n=1 Tax=Reyranella sp. TaxID=1929291 RepID=UPI003D125CCD
MPELPLTGRWACGQLRYRSDAAPLVSLYCQCRDCQYDSGTGHSCHVMLAEAALVLSGPVKLYQLMADSGEAAVCVFCRSADHPRSGTVPGAIFVIAGRLDDRRGSCRRRLST